MPLIIQGQHGTLHVWVIFRERRADAAATEGSEVWGRGCSGRKKTPAADRGGVCGAHPVNRTVKYYKIFSGSSFQATAYFYAAA